jgi:4-hydroxybutyryl-CoA dehydratase/vinylacetyl-CoA-Delta-isomerase
MLAGAMTDPKGHRARKPSEQTDPDQFVHVVQRRPDGVVIRGAKLHNTGGINSHEVLVLPGTGLVPGEEEYAIACAIPADAEGVVFVFGRQSNDTRKLEEGCDIGNTRFGVVGGEAMVIFDDVFVPTERIFLDGEIEHCATLVNYFATWHRANYGGCKGGNADVLIGATAKMTRILGTDRNAIVKDKLIEMIHRNETTYASAIGSSALGYQLPCGSWMVDPITANTVKQNITRNVYEIGRLSHDLAGGFLATIPDSKSFENPEISGWVRKYYGANPDYDVMERIRFGRYIENMTSVTTMVEAMHGAGSPQAQRISMLGQANIEEKIRMADEVIYGTDDVPGLPLPPTPPRPDAPDKTTPK